MNRTAAEGRGAALVVVLALALYLVTLAPGLLWGGGDFAIFQVRAYLGRVDDAVGVFGHPLWVWLAHPFTWLPFREVAWRANFAAAVFAVAALALVYPAALRLTRSRWASLLATGALAVSHTFWTYAVMPKVYSLNALLLAACIYLLLRWRADAPRDRYLLACAFLYGLSFLNHLVMATAAAGFAVFVLVVIRQQQRPRAARSLALAFLVFVAGLVPYLYLLARDATAADTGGTVVGFITGLGYTVTHPLALAEGIGWGVALGGYQFLWLTPVGLWGLALLWRRDRATFALVLLTIGGTWLFLMGALEPGVGSVYVWNLHYYLQAYVVFALAIACGCAELVRRGLAQTAARRGALAVLALALPVVVYAAAPWLVGRFWSDVPGFRPLPGRNNLVYVLSPWKQNETGARAFGERILTALPADSVLLADYSIWSVILYLQVVEGQRPDVTLVMLPGLGEQPAILRQYLGTPHLFLADTYRYYDMATAAALYEVVPEGPVYRLATKTP